METEVKILEVTDIEIKLKKIGAGKCFEGELISVYYDCADVLRLRKKGNRTFLTYKVLKSKQDAKIMDEFEIEVTGFDKARKSLKQLGHKERLVYKKKRTQYKTNDAKFEIDKYPDIPAFLEIEAEDIETIEKYVKALGYSMKDTHAWTGKEVIDYYSRT